MYVHLFPFTQGQFRHRKKNIINNNSLYLIEPGNLFAVRLSRVC